MNWNNTTHFLCCICCIYIEYAFIRTHRLPWILRLYDCLVPFSSPSTECAITISSTDQGVRTSVHIGTPDVIEGFSISVDIKIEVFLKAGHEVCLES